jgi:hypothetical protein
MLRPGESARTVVAARRRWNRTGIELVAGARYHLVAEGRWRDLIYGCDADGYDSRGVVMHATERLRRAPEERWFTLMGTVDADLAFLFRIGTEVFFSPPTSGELICFANDVAFMYWNNYGSVRLLVSRLV